jgi:peptidoglycan/LPS O-acetylase OafA/YrhL
MTRHAPLRPAGKTQIRFRGDIEGLRAVAVALVVLDHLDVPGFGGGFVGVDVFFVISGYLITSLLAAEYGRHAAARGGHGSISIAGFYARRARRILPAALTVIAAVVVASRVLLNPLRGGDVEHDAVWSLLFAANVNSIQQATDYFAGGLEPSVFQHYWSLAVEEQFYLVWPALFLLVAHAGGKLGRAARWRIRVIAAVVVLSAASLTWSITQTAADPASAYFSTFTRAWELALGALLGIVVTRDAEVGRVPAACASFAGAALLVLACARIDAGTAFPGIAALAPTVATALLVAGGLAARPPLPNRALSLAPLRFVGRISYSVYLWHWPLIVFAAALAPEAADEVPTRILLLTLTLALGTLSFHLVEQPGRRLFTWPAKRGAGPAAPPTTVLVGAGAIVSLFVGALAAIPLAAPGARLPAVVSTEAPPPRSAAGLTAAAPRLEPGYAAALAAWQRKVRAGVALTAVPANLRPLSPHLERYVEPYCNPRLPGIVRGECVVGRIGARHVAVLTGDSHAGMFQVALSHALGRRNWRLHVFQRGHCGWAGSVGPRLPMSPGECRTAQAAASTRIRALRPSLLVLSHAGFVTPYRSARDLAASLASFSRLAARVLVLGHTPAVPSFEACLVGSADLSRCAGVLAADYRADTHRERALATRAGALFIDTSTWFCVPIGQRTICPPIVDGAPVWRDGTHITSDLEPKLIPVMKAFLDAEGLRIT